MEKIINHLNTYVGMPAGILIAILNGTLVTELNRLLRPYGEAMAFLVIMYVAVSCMVGALGYHFDKVIYELNDEPDWLLDKLGWTSWSVVYRLSSGTEETGIVTMTLEQALNWASTYKNEHAVAVVKTAGLFRRRIDLE